MDLNLRRMPSILIATLGTEPQVVNVCLDLLQQQGEKTMGVKVTDTLGEVVLVMQKI